MSNRIAMGAGGVGSVVLALALLSVEPADAQVQGDASVYVLAYAEVGPSAERAGPAGFVAYRDAARREPGNAGADVLQQIGRPGHFAVIEGWKDKTAYDQHRHSTARQEFETKLQPLFVSAYDERTHIGLSVGPAKPLPAAGIVVVTHVDTIPPNQPQARDMLQRLASASRMEPGNLRFDVWQGVRDNHFTVIEEWTQSLYGGRAVARPESRRRSRRRAAYKAVPRCAASNPRQPVRRSSVHPPPIGEGPASSGPRKG